VAVAATAVWRVRPSGVNTNGGGFDCSLSSAATGSNGSWATSAGTTTFTDATAGAFTTAMVNSAINISGVGQFTILSRVDANNITITPFPAWMQQTSNFGSAANWTVGRGTDYSHQNAAQASGTAGTASGTTAFSDVVAAAFTAAMVGNAIYITGTGFTTGFYYVTGFTDASHVTIDRSPGTGTAGTWHLGGGWADFWTNCSSGGANIVAGNTVYILGSGVPNPASYTYDYTTTTSPQFTPVAGNATTGGLTTFAGDPATPSGGVPCIDSAYGAIFQTSTLCAFNNLWFVCNGAANGGIGMINLPTLVRQCTFDENGYNYTYIYQGYDVINCEIFSYVTKSATTTQPAVMLGNGGTVIGCNIHDCSGNAIVGYIRNKVLNCIIAKNGGDGIYVSDTSANAPFIIMGNTIDGNGGHGINATTQNSLTSPIWINNVITNHTGVGKYGINVGAGTQAQNDLIKALIDYNTFYNNTANYNAISPGAHDTVLSVSPYVAQSTENYTLS